MHSNIRKWKIIRRSELFQSMTWLRNSLQILTCAMNELNLDLTSASRKYIIYILLRYAHSDGSRLDVVFSHKMNWQTRPTTTCEKGAKKKLNWRFFTRKSKQVSQNDFTIRVMRRVVFVCLLTIDIQVKEWFIMLILNLFRPHDVHCTRALPPSEQQQQQQSNETNKKERKQERMNYMRIHDFVVHFAAYKKHFHPKKYI